MLKLKGLLVAAVLVAFCACEEVPPPIDFSEPLEVLKDTSYVLDNITEPAQDKGILIEDLTGVRCVNCPDAAQTARGLKTNSPKRIIVVGLYTSQPNNLTFPHSGSEDLRTEEATNIYANLFGSPALPGGGVNRKVFSGQTQMNQQHALWPTHTQTELLLKSKVNVELGATKKDDSTYVVSTSYTFMEDLNADAFVSFMLIENDIEAAQSTSSGEDHEYVHEHVLRKMFTPYNGTPLYSSPEEGRVVEKDYEFVIPNHVNLDHASIVVLVNLNEANNKEVLQCMEIDL